MAFGRVFFSAAPTAQNRPELHFRFINSFIQPSRVGSLILAQCNVMGRKTFGKSDLIQPLRFFDPFLLVTPRLRFRAWDASCEKGYL